MRKKTIFFLFLAIAEKKYNSKLPLFEVEHLILDEYAEFLRSIIKRC